MKLVRFGEIGQERPGVLADESHAYDVSDVVGDFDAEFLAGGGLERLRDEVTVPSRLPLVDISGVRLGPPLVRTPLVVCIGLNYRDHARESGMAIPDEPIVFLKSPATIVGPSDPVVIPIASTKTDWEVELGVVIGRRARYLPDTAAALGTVAGYVLSNDVSEREFQLERGGQWDKGKSCETFNPIGPWMTTADELGDPQRIRLWCDVRGERVQDGTTADMIFGVAHLVWYLSQFMVLEPGTIVNTGTPAGVGLGRVPAAYLRAGDEMTLGGELLGEQRHVCAAASADAPDAQPESVGVR